MLDKKANVLLRQLRIFPVRAIFCLTMPDEIYSRSWFRIILGIMGLQASATRALDNGATLNKVLEMVGRVRVLVQ